MIAYRLKNPSSYVMTPHVNCTASANYSEDDMLSSLIDCINNLFDFRLSSGKQVFAIDRSSCLEDLAQFEQQFVLFALRHCHVLTPGDSLGMTSYSYV